MMKNKIGLITTHNVNNYGAMLQTFALSKFLSIYGKTRVINYHNKHISDSMKLVRVNLSIKGVASFIKDIFRLLPRYRVIKKFKQFQKKHLVFTGKTDSKNIKNFNFNDFSHIVAGSDQIWNPACISKDGKIDKNYFLNFAKSQKKISYASSLGSYIFSNEEKVLVKRYLKDFKSISVREEDGKLQLEKFINQKISHVLDPTLLLSEKEWIDLMDLKKSKEKYILLYSVPQTKFLKELCEYFSAKYNLPIYSIDQNPFSPIKVKRRIMDAGPKEFLNLFLNSEFIITDSFHGTCFATNFKKNFVVGHPEGLSNRIESYLKSIGLNERIVKNKEEMLNLSNSINFEKSNDLLLQLRKDSKIFIKNSINSKKVI